jgi:hypothetical protein
MGKQLIYKCKKDSINQAPRILPTSKVRDSLSFHLQHQLDILITLYQARFIRLQTHYYIIDLIYKILKLFAQLYQRGGTVKGHDQASIYSLLSSIERNSFRFITSCIKPKWCRKNKI